MIKLGNILKKGRKKYYIVTSSGIDMDIHRSVLLPPEITGDVGVIETEIPFLTTKPLFIHSSGPPLAKLTGAQSKSLQ